ncbi:MAG TPA: diphosphate--fructose-6-phosphate 1-phosphotransferase [bacterium]|nr:diphosphate--fructose-6-phosphate 1-phosphotransferase [bacterium]
MAPKNSSVSSLQAARAAYKPKLPKVLSGNPSKVAVKIGKATHSIADQDAIRGFFPRTYGQPEVFFAPGKASSSMKKPLKVALVLSGGQAPGGHNVVAGLFDGLKKLNKKNTLTGYLGGPSGLVDNKKMEITSKLMEGYRNTGGFDIIGSGRTKLESKEQFEAVHKNLAAAGIGTLVVVGGDDSNTNAAVLAEYFKAQEIDIRVIGCPKTIDGDLKNHQIEVSFGFDTATKVYAELAGNVGRDCLSAKKYWHFIKVMGRSASHIALEVALKVHPNVCLISEEVAANKWTLEEVVEQVARVVDDRAARKMNYGVVLVPEGLLEFVPEMKGLISELNEMLAHNAEFEKLESANEKVEFVKQRLADGSKRAFHSLPHSIQVQLLADRDPHGNVQVSKIETEKLLIEAVDIKLKHWKKEGRFQGKFSGQGHFFGYEGRCADPSNFDADYCYALGYTAAYLAAAGLTGYLSSARDLLKPAAQWKAGGVPLTMMMNVERRHGKDKPVIQKALVDLDGKPFRTFEARRAQWAMEDDYASPGPIQFWGPSEVADAVPETLRLERGK